MRLCVFGLSISSAWGNGHATLWRGLCRALGRAGHHLTFFERDVPYYAAARDLQAIEGGELVLYPHWGPARAAAARAVAASDAAIVTSYCPDGVAATELVAASRVPRKVFYDLDPPITIAPGAAYLGPRGLRDFDLVLSFTGGPGLPARYAGLGARRVAPLYACVDPDAHRPAPPRDEYRADLSYLGTWAPDRDEALRTLLLEPARRLPERRFLIAGSLYPEGFPWSANVVAAGHVTPGSHPAFYASAGLTLNVTRAAMAALGWCPSARLFEAAACGAPILSDAWAGLEGFFAEGREILVARSADEAVAALAVGPAERARIAAAARERVLAEHGARKRAAELVAALEGGVD